VGTFIPLTPRATIGADGGGLEISSKANADGAERIVLLHSRLEVIEAVAELPILALDATMPAPVVRHYLPRLNVLADVQPHAPHMTVNQIIGGWGKTSLIPSDRIPFSSSVVIEQSVKSWHFDRPVIRTWRPRALNDGIRRSI
jgi:hypothetical protein